MGDTELYGALYKKQVRAEKAKALSGCKRFAGTNVADVAKCKTVVRKMAALLGEKTERADRNEQDGAQEEIASVLEACKRGEGAGCEEKAKTLFERAGGVKADYDAEKKEGLGKRSAETMSSCMKQDGSSAAKSSKADVEKCRQLAKTQLKESGGDENDFWADKKRGMMKEALDYYREEEEVEAASGKGRRWS